MYLPIRRSHRLVLIATVILVFAIAGCDSGDDRVDDSGPNADLVITFDGGTCLSDSAAVLAAGGAHIAFENATDDRMQFSVIRLQDKADFDAALADVPEGGEKEGLVAFPAGGELVAWARAEPRQEQMKLVILETGWHVVNCLHVDAGETDPDQIWRGKSFEVREPDPG